MGTTESKNTHRYRSNKPPPSIVHHYQYRDKQTEVLMTRNRKKDSLKRKNETIGKRKCDEREIIRWIYLVPLLSSSPLNPIVPGSILNHSFPLQRSFSEMPMMPSELSRHPITEYE